MVPTRLSVHIADIVLKLNLLDCGVKGRMYLVIRRLVVVLVSAISKCPPGMRSKAKCGLVCCCFKG